MGVPHTGYVGVTVEGQCPFCKSVGESGGVDTPLAAGVLTVS